MTTEKTGGSRTTPAGVGERILRTAYGLFTVRGIRDVGIEELIETAGVAKATFYRHFRSKDALVLAFLDRSGQVWVRDLKLNGNGRAEDPALGLLAVFDFLAEDMRIDGFDGGSFIKVLLEMGPEHPLGRASIEHLSRIRGDIRAVAEEAGLRDCDRFARSWHVLMKGSVICAVEGDREGIRCARLLAEQLIEHHRS